MADDDRVLFGPERVRDKLDTTVAQIARVYDYCLGGKDNFAVDREVGDLVREIYPEIVHTARANRAFLTRAVRYLAGEAGIRQFLDIGTGIPTADNTHEVAQRVAPSSRVVYVDNDPMVLAHARALLTSGPVGQVAYVDADLRDVPAVLAGASRVLDFGQPVAVMLVAVLHCIPDWDDPHGIVARLMDAVPAGSYLVVSHPPGDVSDELSAETARRFNKLLAQKVTHRGLPKVERFFEGLELLEPGVVPVLKWRPTRQAEAEAAPPAAMWGAVGRKA
jgi:S-adenosyl methyltransferase